MCSVRVPSDTLCVLEGQLQMHKGTRTYIVYIWHALLIITISLCCCDVRESIDIVESLTSSSSSLGPLAVFLEVCKKFTFEYIGNVTGGDHVHSIVAPFRYFCKFLRFHHVYVYTSIFSTWYNAQPR